MIGRRGIRLLTQFLIPKGRSCSTSTEADKIEDSPLLQKLSAEYKNVNLIAKALQREEASDVDFERWRSHINFMKSYTFKEEDCFKMIYKYPLLLKIPQKDFEEVTRYWYGCDFGQHNFESLLFLQPILFEAEIENITKRVPYLRTKFRKSEALANLLAVSPNIMFDNWESVLNKMDFLVEKGFTMGDLLTSEALSFTFDFMKLRFNVLEKCGIFQVQKLAPHKKNKYRKPKHENPPLYNILMDNDKEFAESVAQITLEEYNTCKELYEVYGLEDEDEENEDESEENEYDLYSENDPEDYQKSKE